MRIKVEYKDRATLFPILFQLGYAYDKNRRAYRTLTDLNFHIDSSWEIVRLYNDKNLNFEGHYADYVWPKDATEIIKEITDTEITIDNVGDYSAIICREGIKVGCQTISFGKFDEIVEGVKKYKNGV